MSVTYVTNSGYPPVTSSWSPNSYTVGVNIPSSLNSPVSCGSPKMPTRTLMYFDSENGILIIKRGDQEITLNVREWSINQNYMDGYGNFLSIDNKLEISFTGTDAQGKADKLQRARDVVKVIEVTNSLESSSAPTG